MSNVSDAQIQEWIKRGEDPKEFLLKECAPQCTAWKEKLGRCEAKLKSLVNADPEMSCMYPLRDWVTCIEACVQPAITRNLFGSKYM
ncbi:ubiquinol-cytochrome C reductase hinge protein (macronuclear) [Tetrahymena thermophila SB210]|uniref:Ubiquinol-cytochrome C reductase hinge protein n=1 Tax=Tetrahymena thermophila (strain SB210) TaxID=312017 RepID=Q23K66_TETTS|nr:ubiquinol-cytochrome C reductase hinge protein [Tetrahymena thermophila SB210]8B6J_F Chain F, Ubiquinol-cytochrome C reductase hinge protein [Tetrahymena thermophila SB210]8B6J_f Chain f, Ubiquinol-cytochrome C reductase hinge protein [Tetrahymena thermophila SB210]8BQS_F Chain F, Ubiquinol-cytochrome C reductase hinge protein [Tetrahymena thermophila SB210]8BQS_f Chain f, Ubiquinol-cytochrome C reductase hinge protein [Tetrahymena thermophila SB210]EAR96977.2 ubiquinol-cytochrome C reducta|eukprot:XP_001017222.2 ubiquinol-cytochrome C reductase hinge protein [Tetrahymena thermophila SB210]